MQFNREGTEGGHWTLKEGWTVPEDVMDEGADTPEMTCLYESLEAGHMRLKNMGVKRLHRGEDVTAAVTEIAKDTKTDSVIRHGALAVQELLGGGGNHQLWAALHPHRAGDSIQEPNILEELQVEGLPGLAASNQHLAAYQ